MAAKEAKYPVCKNLRALNFDWQHKTLKVQYLNMNVRRLFSYVDSTIHYITNIHVMSAQDAQYPIMCRFKMLWWYSGNTKR